MVQDILRPGVENRGDSQGGFEVVASKLHQRGRGAGEQQRIQPLLVVLNERIQFVRESEHDVEVRDGQQVLDLLLQPPGAVELLAARTVPVAAGVRHEVFIPQWAHWYWWPPSAGV